MWRLGILVWALGSLFGCGIGDERRSEIKSVANCQSFFYDSFRLEVAGYRGKLSTLPQGLNGLRAVSLDADEGVRAACGWMSADGSIAFDRTPFFPDYTLKLTLNSASCGQRKLKITGKCISRTQATADLSGSKGRLWK